jgi:hypothetical protein
MILIAVNLPGYYRAVIGKLPEDIPQSVLRIVQWGRWVRHDIFEKKSLTPFEEGQMLAIDAQQMGSTTWWFQPDLAPGSRNDDGGKQGPKNQ